MSLPFSSEAVSATHEPLLAVESNREGLPVGATAAQVVSASPSRVWEVISDPVRFTKHVPMIDHVKVEGERVRMELRFKVALLSFGFKFECRSVKDEGNAVELHYVHGEPRDANIRFDIQPHDDSSKSIVFARIGFDILSLGWLVKTFLKHHPEIRYGVYPGSALSLLDAVKRTAEER